MNAEPDREAALTDAFVALADTLVDEYDVIDLLHRLVETSTQLLAADYAGLMLSDGRGELQVMASSTEATRLLELFELQTREGPCLDTFTSGRPVSASDLAEAETSRRWPQFAPRATQEGFRSVHALPMRLRTDTIGAMNLFTAAPGPFPPGDLRIAQALADVATIGILQERAIRRSEVLAEQLQTALNSRVVIEQAKGMIAARYDTDMAAAFTLLRTQARRTRQRLSDVARYVVEGKMAVELPPTRQ